MGLTGVPLLLLVGVATVVAPVATAFAWRRRVSQGTWSVPVRVLSVIGCQVLAVSLTFLAVNDNFVFYASWGDVLGVSSPKAHITTANLVRPGEGTVEVLPVRGVASGVSSQVLVWFPPQYSQPQYAHTVFPVVMALPGQPSSPAILFSHFDFGRVATAAIADHTVRPFVAVFPPLMTNPPRDTECTDVPGGPRAETWLSTDVRTAVLQHARVSPKAADWGLMGYSTGAFCAVKLLLAHPSEFTAAAGFGGYYQPITDHTTGSLFGGSRIRYDENSPLWLYGRSGLAAGHRMLLISAAQDRDSYAETQKMLSATRGDPGVSSLIFPTGGHNYRDYQNAIPDALRWFGEEGFGR